MQSTTGCWVELSLCVWCVLPEELVVALYMMPRTSKKKSKRMGRPLIVIDWETVDNLAAIHCTGPEISVVMKISEDTLTRATKREHKITFAEYIRQKRGKGKASLRRLQWKAAEAGDKTMLVWLGKNWLDQTDRRETTTHIEGEVTVNSVDEAKTNIAGLLDRLHVGQQKVPVDPELN